MVTKGTVVYAVWTGTKFVRRKNPVSRLVCLSPVLIALKGVRSQTVEFWILRRRVGIAHHNICRSS